MEYPLPLVFTELHIHYQYKYEITCCNSQRIRIKDAPNQKHLATSEVAGILKLLTFTIKRHIQLHTLMKWKDNME